MEEALEMALAKDTKERMAGVERLYQLLEASRRGLTSAEATSLVDACMQLLGENSNFRVSQVALQVLASAAVLAPDHFKLHLNAVVPAAVDRLGDPKQPVRDAARRLLLTLMEVCSPTIIVERAGSCAWAHKSWRIREEFARTVTSAVGLFASTELPLQRILLPPVLQLTNDSNNAVREAAILCLEEMYAQLGTQFLDELQRYNLQSSLAREIYERLEKIAPKIQPSEVHTTHNIPMEMKSSGFPEHNQKRTSPKTKSPKTKNSARDLARSRGESDVTETPVEPVRIFSEKELSREIEKIASTLVPEKDWSVRIAAMQRVEGLVFGGAANYPSFTMLLKQLVNPLSTQLSDRRSSVVKQVCHLLCLLSKELLADFEGCAEMFIPVLLKLVVITVLVIAESADNCIKMMLRNCKAARVLPRIVDCAKNDRSAILRARCCEYALLVLECWTDAPEIQRSIDLYEDLMKCCVADAMSEVRSTARSCYRMFAKTWPERSRRLFLSFDPAIQRLISEEEAVVNKRYPSPFHEGSMQLARCQSQTHATCLPGYGTSALVAMDRSVAVTSETTLTSSNLFQSLSKTTGKGAERSLESMLHASKQKVTAIESLLRGINLSENLNSSETHASTLDLGANLPSAYTPPFQPVNPLTDSLKLQNPVSDRRSFEMLEMGSPAVEKSEIRTMRRVADAQVDDPYLNVSSKDTSSNYSINNHVPNFQKPLLRKQVMGRPFASKRNSFDDLQFGAMSNYLDGLASLSEAITKGLTTSSDWSVRVSAFNFIRTFLQQGSKGTQEVILSFEKVMKMFLHHLDDPHHKVAHAALSALADIVPACRKPFESYLDRILPHVFSRLIDPKEMVRQSCSATLKVVSKTYGIDSLLPALLRSLDEQRSPKAKLAVIEFANSSFNKHPVNCEGSGNSGILKLWLAKLEPLVTDKNTKLKEAAVNCIISVYSHFDSIAVLNFILTLSVEEQNYLRRALKQYTPRIEVELLTFLSKKERQRSKSFYDQLDVAGGSSEEVCGLASKQRHHSGMLNASSSDGDVARSSTQEATQMRGSVTLITSDKTQDHMHQNSEAHSDFDDVAKLKSKDLMSSADPGVDNDQTCASNTENVSCIMDTMSTRTRLDIARPISSDYEGAFAMRHGNENISDLNFDHAKFTTTKCNTKANSGPSIPQLLHQICNGNDEDADVKKQGALQQLIKASMCDDQSVWTRYFNQILTAVLELFDDPDSLVRELALSLILQMLNYQKNAFEDSVEIVIEKLVHAMKDTAAKVSNVADHCLCVVLSEYDPYRGLSVVVPLLVSDDEKTLVICINCLTKLVGRLSIEEVTTQLPTFLPSLFDAFGNQSPDVRKTVVFCLVDIYIMLGKAFLPYLKGLNSTQLRLVTIYASRMVQARSGAATEVGHN